MKKNYNYCIDMLRGIACICVVFMHCEFPGALGIAVQCISRFCVPFFFMVSGYYSFYADKRSATPVDRKAAHIAKITAVSCALYIFLSLRQGIGIFLSVPAEGWIKWVLFNQPVRISGHLWFLFALLYVYVLYGAVERLGLTGTAYKSIPVLLVLYTLLAQGAHLAGYDIPNMYYRNWLIEGFPYFMMGHWIHKNQESLKIKNSVLVAVVCVSTLLCLAERKLMGRDFGVNICTIPQVVALFLLAVNNGEVRVSFLQHMGKKYSLMIYILHPMVQLVLDGLYSRSGLAGSVAALYLKPLAVVALTMLVSAVLLRMKTGLSLKRGT